MTIVAVLYIDPRGPYPRMTGDDPSLIAIDGTSAWCSGHAHQGGYLVTDARKYTGPYPVVAHPPCRHWSKLRHLAHVQCNGPYNGPRDPGPCGWHGRARNLRNGCCPVCGAGWVTSDRDCAIRAVEQVRARGGVLEHPAGSLLWAERGLPLPSCVTDAYGGYTIELDQVAWGHACRKRTWLYLVGVPRSALEAPPFPEREPTHWCAGGNGRTATRGGKARPPGIKAASSEIARRTPPLFAEYLVRLARSVVPR